MCYKYFFPIYLQITKKKTFYHDMEELWLPNTSGGVSLLVEGMKTVLGQKSTKSLGATPEETFMFDKYKIHVAIFVT